MSAAADIEAQTKSGSVNAEQLRREIAKLKQQITETNADIVSMVQYYDEQFKQLQAEREALFLKQIPETYLQELEKIQRMIGSVVTRARAERPNLSLYSL